MISIERDKSMTLTCKIDKKNQPRY